MSKASRRRPHPHRRQYDRECVDGEGYAVTGMLKGAIISITITIVISSFSGDVEGVEDGN